MSWIGGRARHGDVDWTRAALISVFVAGSLYQVVPPVVVGLPFGWDALVYTEAARAFLEGGDPWGTQWWLITFAAPPPSLLPYLPFVWLPDALVSASWLAIAAGSAIYAIRRLRLPWWWLLFPPVVLGIITGSSALLVLALLVRGGVVADTTAIVARVYAALPLLLLARWRSLVAGAVAGLVTVLYLPWWQFIENRELVAATFAEQSGGGLSAFSVPWLLPVAVVSLVALGRKRAAWLLVPALWPATQLYYATIALPALASLPATAIALAFPVPGLIVGGMIADVLRERATRQAGHRRAVSAPG